MLTLVEARNSQGALLSLPIDDASGGYSVKDVEGLDPVKATIVSSSFAGQDGAQYQNSRREERNVKIKLGLEADYISTTVRDLRKRLYNYFMPKSKVDLRFYDSDGLVVNISGWVETCESPLFSQEPEVDISILCLDSDFIDLNEVVVNGMSTSATDEMLFSYEGTVETGIEFVFNINRSITEFTIYHRPPDGSLRTMDFAAPLVAGDILTINTVAGDKRVTRSRAGSVISLLYAKSPQSGWIELLNGSNYIRVYATGAAIPYAISYTPRYGGL